MLMAKSKQSLVSLAKGYKVNRRFHDRAIESFLFAVNTPRALTVWLLYSQNEHAQLANLGIDPDNYASPEAFRLDYLATSFLSKSDFLQTGIDLEAVALASWFAAEKRCQDTNNRFRTGFGELLKDADHAWVHNAVVRKINQILYDDFDAEEWLDSCAWGPGSTVLVKGRDTSPEHKFLRDGGITSELYTLVSTALPQLTSWKPTYEIVIGNVVLTVPKNSKTHRVIASEPGINSFFQLGIGKMLAKRLLRVGISIRDQSRNQRLAYKASRSGALATVDFSSASDNISEAVVRSLLPLDWYHAMNISRSLYSSVKGVNTRLSKFSSMGNGFTFPLQTLIFYALAIATCERVGASTEEVSVYGDDVILPSVAYPLFLKMCSFYGFALNDAKSFHKGPFRESCGEHYFGGVNCKPLYLKELLDGLHSIYKLANGVKRVAKLTFGFDGRWAPMWETLYASVPKPLRFHIPEDLGDVGFAVEQDQAVPPPARAGHQVEGWRVKTLSFIPLGYEADHEGVLLSRLHSRSTERQRNNFVTFRRAVRVKVITTHVRRWQFRGPWLF